MITGRRATAQGALALGALGVVFGDIGTSPLYTVQTVFSPSDPHPLKVSHDSIFGVTSLIFWSVTIIVTLTYVTLVMRADNDGEGGIMALTALIRRRALPGGARAKAVLAGLGVFGASLFFGDSASRITGWAAMPCTPSTPITVNQTAMTGPNRRPTAPVPSR